MFCSRVQEYDGQELPTGCGCSPSAGTRSVSVCWDVLVVEGCTVGAPVEAEDHPEELEMGRGVINDRWERPTTKLVTLSHDVSAL